MSVLVAGDRVAFPGEHFGVAYLGTVVEEDLNYSNPHWRIEWDDRPEFHQSVPEESLLKLTQIAPTPGNGGEVVAERVYRDRTPSLLRGRTGFAHITALLSGIGALAIGAFAVVSLH